MCEEPNGTMQILLYDRAQAFHVEFMLLSPNAERNEHLG